MILPFIIWFASANHVKNERDFLETTRMAQIRSVTLAFMGN